MANPWFRMYSEIVYNPKVQVLTEALRWRYVALLCIHCNGQYEATPSDEIALALRIDEDEWLKTRDIFIKRRLLAEDGSIENWDSRQYISDLKDPTAAERQQKYRDKKKREKERNATVTSRSPESDTDTDIKPPVTPQQAGGLQPSPESSAAPRKKREATTFVKWIESVRAAGEKPVADYQALLQYMKTVGLPEDFVGLAWSAFKKRYLNDEKAKRKRYIEWRDVFLRAVKEDWFGYWYVDAEGIKLTKKGMLADMEAAAEVQA